MSNRHFSSCEKAPSHLGVQDLCRKLKEQLDSLAETIKVDSSISKDEMARRKELMDRLKRQLAELSI